jgi:hypothetical protein
MSVTNFIRLSQPLTLCIFYPQKKAGQLNLVRLFLHQGEKEMTLMIIDLRNTILLIQDESHKKSQMAIWLFVHHRFADTVWLLESFCDFGSQFLMTIQRSLTDPALTHDP